MTEPTAEEWKNLCVTFLNYLAHNSECSNPYVKGCDCGLNAAVDEYYKLSGLYFEPNPQGKQE